MSFDSKAKLDVSQARFATLEEIEERYPTLDYQNPEKVGDAGIVIMTDGKKSIVDNSDNFTLTVGSTGSKKTRNVVMPHIISACHAGNSMVIHAPKGDIYKTLKPYLENKGYRILTLNYRKPNLGDRCNPLQDSAELYQQGKKDEAREQFMHFSERCCERVNSADEPYWHLTASFYMCGLIECLAMMLPANEVTIDNIYNLHIQGNEKCGTSTFLQIYSESAPQAQCWKMLNAAINLPNDTKRSVYGVFLSAIAPFIQNEAIIDQTSNSTFRAEELVDQKTALFIISRDEASTYGPLISYTIDQIYYKLTDMAEQNGGCLKRKVNFIIDEFGNLTSPLSDIEIKLTMSRARGIYWHLVCQSLNQLKRTYKEDVAQIILDNCNNIVYLHSPDSKLIKHISDLCGERSGKTIVDLKTPLCPVDMLRHLDKDKGECLMLLGRTRPFLTRLVDISKYYGVAPMEKLDIPKRNKQDLLGLDFKKIVMKIEKDKREKAMRSREEEHEKNRKKLIEDYVKGKKVDPNDIVPIMDTVICELEGA